MLNDTELADLVGFYERDDAASAVGRWRLLFDPSADGPIALVNRFILRERAHYDDGREAAGGFDAFMAYAATSVPALARVGGRFLVSSPVLTSMFGPPDGTQVVVVGWFPDRAALLTMLRDPEYRDAFEHRRAAVVAESVVAASAL
ncbi:MAG: DUF1330 domain-containing protein [Candidatus Binatia bacterium]